MKFNIESTSLCHRLETITQMLENAISMEDMMNIEFIEKAVGDMCLQQAVPELYQKMVEAKKEAARGLRLKAGEQVTNHYYFLDYSTLNAGKMISVMATDKKVDAAAQGQVVPDPISKLAHANATERMAEAEHEKTAQICLLSLAGRLTKGWEVQKRHSFINNVYEVQKYYGTNYAFSLISQLTKAS